MSAARALKRLKLDCVPSTSPVACVGSRSLSTTAPLQAGRALKKVPRIMLHPKRMGPKRMTPKVTDPGAIRTKHKTGTPLSAHRDPEIFRPLMSMDSLPLFDASALDGSSATAPPGKALRYSSALKKLYNVYGMEVRMKQESPYTEQLTTVVTRDTHALIQRLATAAQRQQGDESPLRICLTGHQWSGKSCLMTQAVAYAQDRKWLVIYVPDILPLINGTEQYAYSEADGFYHQDEWAARFIKQISDANKDVMPKDLAKEIQAALKSQQPTIALGELVDKLLGQTETPVLVAIDGAQALFRATDYIDGSTLAKLETYAMASTRLLLDLATGARPIKRGGVVIAQSYEHPDRQARVLEAVLGVKDRYPYEELGNLTYALLAAKLERYEVGKLDRKEAVGLFGLMRDTERLLAAPSDRLFLQSYISSDGLAGHMKNVLTHSLATA